MSPWKSPSSAIHRRRVRSRAQCSRLTEPRCKLAASPCTPDLRDGDAGPRSPLQPQPYSRPPLHSLHLLPGLRALQAAVPHQPHAHSREVMRHPTSPFRAANAWGACPPTQRQLIKGVFLNLCLPPCSRHQIVPSIFMTPVIHKHQDFGRGTKAFFLWPMTT